MYKLTKGEGFLHFYYRAMSYETSKELKTFLYMNEWYYKKQSEDVREQIKQRFHRLREEEKNGDNKA